MSEQIFNSVNKQKRAQPTKYIKNQCAHIIGDPEPVLFACCRTKHSSFVQRKKYEQKKLLRKTMWSYDYLFIKKNMYTELRIASCCVLDWEIDTKGGIGFWSQPKKGWFRTIWLTRHPILFQNLIKSARNFGARIYSLRAGLWLCLHLQLYCVFVFNSASTFTRRSPRGRSEKKELKLKKCVYALNALFHVSAYVFSFVPWFVF